MSALLRTPLAEALRARIKAGIDKVVMIGSTAGAAIQLVAGRDSFWSESPKVVAPLAIVIALATCGLLGWLGRAPWTPKAYIGLLLLANVVYLARFGPWLGMGVAYVVTIALACVFLRSRWWSRILLALAGTPLVLGVLIATGAMASPSLQIDDSFSLDRAAIAAVTAMIGVAVIVSYLVRQLRSARRTIEHALAVEREQRIERIRVEAEITRAHRADLIAELAAEVGADIGEALAIIQARARALAAELHGAVAEECLGDITEAATTAAMTMRSLTAFAPDVGEEACGNASEVVRALPKLMSRTMPSRIALDVAAENGAWVPIGATELARICSNLVLNARDAIPQAGTIVVRLSRTDTHAVIVVRDDGTGMGPDVLAQLFQPFFTTKPVGRGTGLGLATTRILVERACGTIEVTSEVNRGSQFTIRLPLATVAARGPAARRRAPRRSRVPSLPSLASR